LNFILIHSQLKRHKVKRWVVSSAGRAVDF
jgi:hypothetical protein